MAKHSGHFKKGNQYYKIREKNRVHLTAEEKKITKITRVKLKLIIHKYLTKNVAQLKKISQHPKTPAIDMMVISVIIKAISTGDQVKIQWFLERIFGRRHDTAPTISIAASVKETQLEKLSDKEIESLIELTKKIGPPENVVEGEVVSSDEDL